MAKRKARKREDPPRTPESAVAGGREEPGPIDEGLEHAELAETGRHTEPAEAAQDQTPAPAQRAPIPSRSQTGEVLVVGIGASAGGLKPLQSFFRALPADTGLAFVIVQHLDPRHASMMAELISRHTGLPVMEAQDGQTVEPNRAYIKPPGKDIVLEGNTLRLARPLDQRQQQLPIDRLFRSLAAERGERAVAVVLSGSGRDGTLGIKEIKGVGGMVMAQAEEEAEYAGMPGSAIGTGLVDFILPVERMPEQILSFLKHPYLREEGEKPAAGEAGLEQILHKILMLVRSRSGTDFSRYKRSTVHRRINRRLALHRLSEPAEYLKLLRRNPQEVEELFLDLVINVTRFFRDPEAFATLRERVEELLKEKSEEEELRAWVVGCSSGEEAYSLAILLLEVMDALEKYFRVKIFATDVNRRAIETARAAIYPDSIATDVSEERLERFFLKQDMSFRVREQVREMVIFAVHDITRDPPFSLLDLVSCRNLLIYMEQELQKATLPLLHYGLRPGGLLFLGTSESTGEFNDLFRLLDSKEKVYRALPADTEPYRGRFRLPPSELEQGRLGRPGPRPEVPPGRAVREPREIMEQAVMRRYTPAGVLTDRDHRILYFHGDTSKFLRPPVGPPQLDLQNMARRELSFALSKALREAEEKGQAVSVRDLEVEYGGEILDVALSVAPLTEHGALYFAVTFEDLTQPEGQRQRAEAVNDARVRELEHALFATKQEMQATIEEQETANEELKSANEELQANGEELQSTNEELETSREELQSTNEELETVNTALEEKNQELWRAHNDILNLFAATSIGTVFLDTELRIKRFTPAVRRVFNLIDSDVGRPITDLASKLNYGELERDAQEALERLEHREAEVSTRDGQWYSVDIRPYRTSDNVIEGVVVTFANVTELKEAQKAGRENARDAESLLELVGEPLLLLDGELTVRAASEAFCRTYGLRAREVAGRGLSELGGGWDAPELRSSLEELLGQGTELEDFRLEAELPPPRRRVLRLGARAAGADGGAVQRVLLSVRQDQGDSGG